MPILGGALTPTETYTTFELGADVIKVFPAEFFGPAYIKSLKAPFPHLNIMPTGGVTPETVGDFLKAGGLCHGCRQCARAAGGAESEGLERDHRAGEGVRRGCGHGLSPMREPRKTRSKRKEKHVFAPSR
jgi:2-keto-3-deoxy-6-phosphogluconate aldolase